MGVVVRAVAVMMVEVACCVDDSDLVMLVVPVLVPYASLMHVSDTMVEPRDTHGKSLEMVTVSWPYDADLM